MCTYIFTWCCCIAYASYCGDGGILCCPYICRVAAALAVVAVLVAEHVIVLVMVPVDVVVVVVAVVVVFLFIWPLPPGGTGNNNSNNNSSYGGNDNDNLAPPAQRQGAAGIRCACGTKAPKNVPFPFDPSLLLEKIVQFYQPQRGQHLYSL